MVHPKPDHCATPCLIPNAVGNYKLHVLMHAGMK